MKRLRATGIMARAGVVPFWGLLGAVLAIPLLGGSAGAQQPPAQVGGELPVTAVRQIEELLAAKAQRNPAQRKVSSQFLEAQRTPAQRTVNSQLLDALRAPLRGTTAAGTALVQATASYAKDERVMVDIRADVTPAVLTHIRDLGGTVITSVPKYESIRAQLPLRAVEMLAALDAIRTIRPADEAATRKDNTSAGDIAHRAKSARTTHRITGTGIGIGVISDGVRTLAARQASGDLPARVTVLPGQEGSGDEGTALLEIVHDLAPKAPNCISRRATEVRRGSRQTSRRCARPAQTSSSTTSATLSRSSLPGRHRREGGQRGGRRRLLLLFGGRQRRQSDPRHVLGSGRAITPRGAPWSWIARRSASRHDFGGAVWRRTSWSGRVG